MLGVTLTDRKLQERYGYLAANPALAPRCADGALDIFWCMVACGKTEN